MKNSRRRPLARLFILMALVLPSVLLGACGGRPASSALSGPSSTRDFTAHDLDGNVVRLSDSRGERVVLLSFFATWCGPCVAELPHLRKLYEANKARGFLVIAISIDGPETAANVAHFSRRNDVPFPTVVDSNSTISNLYNPHKSVPFSVLIDKDGVIVRAREGYVQGDEELVAKDVAAVLDRITGTGSTR